MNVSSLKNYNNYNNKIFLSFNGGLPTKVFEQILSYLNPKDHESAVLVSKYWYKIGKNYAQKEEYRSFKYLTAFLINNIDSVLYPIIIKKLQKILKKNEFFQSLNLIQLKPLLFEDLRDEIFNILKDLSENSLEKLYIYERKSRLANDLFYLLKVHKRIDGLYKVGFMHFSSVISRDQFFVKLSQEMALNRFKEEGVRLILKIKSPDLRIKALYDMIVNSNKNRVEEIINKIPDLKSSFIQALKLVSNENLNVENPDKNQSHKFQNLIVKSTIDENQNKKAWVNELHLDVLEMGLRSWEFSVELAKNGIIFTALVTACAIVNSIQRDGALQQIKQIIRDTSDPEQIEDVINLLIEDSSVHEILVISKAFIENSDFESLREIVNEIPHKILREFILRFAILNERESLQ